MKILHIVQCYHPVKGGAEWLAQNLSEQFANRHHDLVTVFTAAATKPAYFWRNEGAAMPAGIEQINGVTVRRFKLFRGLQFVRMVLARGFYRLQLPYHDWMRTIQVGPIIPEFPRAIADNDADIMMATTFPFLHMQYAVMGARRAKKPLVLIGAIHVADKWGYDRKMFIRAIQQADAYIALTHFEKEYLVGKGIQPAKISVIGGGVEASQFIAADGSQVRQKYGWGSAPIIAVITRQSELKRLDTVIEAMPKIWAQQPDVHLLMAGARTNYSVQLDKMIAALSPAQQAKITLLNDFPESEKPELLAAADLLLHPSGNESFGIVFAEAWAAGKPVIGADVGALASLIAEGKDGLLFRYGDAASMAQKVCQLLVHPRQAVAMGLAGREKVLANYTWEIVADRVRQVYTQLTARGR
jgi:glycogen synthase